MIIFILTTAVAVTVVASHTHSHFKPPFKEQDIKIISPARNLTWKKILTCGTSIRFTVRSQTTRSEKTSRLYVLDWRLPQVFAESVHIINHLVLGVYNPLHSQNTSLVQTVTHARCHFVMKDKERLRSPLNGPTSTPWAPLNSLYCHAPFYTFRSLTN